MLNIPTSPTQHADSELQFDWVHVTHGGTPAFVETYGFSGSQNVVNLEGVLIRPRNRPSRTLHVFMHPSSTLQLLPVPRAFAKRGAHVLCAGSRYARNDTAGVLENVLVDLGAYIHYAREVLGYEKIVLAGWSGGGALAMCYQAEAEQPSIERTPAGDAIDLRSARLIPADAVIFQAAHVSRAQLLLDCIDPSVLDENDPDRRNAELDIYDPKNPNQPPYSADFIRAYRAAQLRRMRAITARVKQTLADLRSRGTGEVERGLITHRTMADPRYLDSTLDPNDRRPKWCYLGVPETVNNGPVGLARFTTLRSWLSQWSIEDSRGDACACAKRVSVPLLVMENSADDAVPQPHSRMLFDAATTQDKTFTVIRGANHYYAGQPEQLEQAMRQIFDWSGARGFDVGS
ncbi:alpha/beta hydrolase [Peristeroidobacter soli]|jgi:pimeloyl-ACP methyl ester carboxylesterase|uniref:alpha/beta hydrolase n=1 Tax=Peristeroidobacter soli TaxID=2497877 RepID=UPI00101C55BE|nr:alpha/beta fold hydrolase [Peristeroidobacter soli]